MSWVIRTDENHIPQTFSARRLSCSSMITFDQTQYQYSQVYVEKFLHTAGIRDPKFIGKLNTKEGHKTR